MIFTHFIEPSLIRVVPIVFERLDLATTTYDPVFKEETANEPSYLPPLEIMGQIRFGKKDKNAQRVSGDDPEGEGWVTIQKSVFDQIADPPNKRDKIISIDGEACEKPFYVKEVRKIAHYSRFTLVRIYFVTEKEYVR